MYTINDAHTDGRHASTHPDDRNFWISQGCAGCMGVPAGTFLVSEHSTMWVGQRDNVLPVIGFTLEEGRSIYDIETPVGRFEIWITRQSEDEVWFSVYTDGDRIFMGEDPSWTEATQRAATVVSTIGWPKK